MSMPLAAMNFKRKRVAAACFCILFLLIFVSLLLYFSQQLGTGLSSELQTSSKVRAKGINDTFKLDLDALQTYDIVMDSGLMSEGGGVDRRKLVGMPDARGLLRIPHKVYLSGHWPVGKEVLVTESSFAVSFTMSLYQPSSGKKKKKSIKQSPTGLAFLVLPSYSEKEAEANLTQQLGLGPDGSLNLTNSTARTGHFPGGGQVSVEIRRLPADGLSMPLNDPSGHIVVLVHVEPAPAPAAATARYTVWIEYARLTQSLSVFIGAGEGKERPDNPVAIKKNISYIDAKYWAASFGLYSSVGQLLKVHTWSSDVEGATCLMKYIMDKYIKGAAIFMALLLSLSATVAAAAISSVAWYFRTKQRRWKKEQDKLAKVMQSLPGVPTQVDFADIRKATSNFQEASKLGKGGFSSVYRCQLPAAATCRRSCLTEVAIKKFTRGVEEQRYEDFLAEVSIINRLRHKNVVPLVGWSYNKGEPLLIYEYMTNGSLDQHLFRRGGNEEEQDTSIRQWGTRYSIANDIATGLHYVHHEHEPMVLHRDIKASNIMLDSNFRARLGDFGIACTVAADRTSVTGVAGTWGYIAPDYAMSNKATRQTDIYAFGVLILELVTGKKNRNVLADDGHIAEWVWRLHGEGRLLDAVDDHQESIAADEVQCLLLLGLACTNPNPSNRPSMAVAVQVITKLAPPPDVPPERPAFVWPLRESPSLDSEYGCTSTIESTVELVQIVQHSNMP